MGRAGILGRIPALRQRYGSCVFALRFPVGPISPGTGKYPIDNWVAGGPSGHVGNEERHGVRNVDEGDPRQVDRDLRGHQGGSIVLLALLAWSMAQRLGQSVSGQAESMAEAMLATVKQVGDAPPAMPSRPSTTGPGKAWSG
jgi:hypothetical protein